MNIVPLFEDESNRILLYGIFTLAFHDPGPFRPGQRGFPD
jgi:hypothetical protein